MTAKLILSRLGLLAYLTLCNTVHAEASVISVSSYCHAAGGVVEYMPLNYVTSKGNFQGIAQAFCNFHLPNGFISIGLDTFASPYPSIAATYIKTQTEIGEGSPLWEGTYTNPSWNVCKNLGGAMAGYVANASYSNSLGDADICVFGDGSMVSAWTLIYMSQHKEGYDNVKNKVRAEPLVF